MLAGCSNLYRSAEETSRDRQPCLSVACLPSDYGYGVVKCTTVVELKWTARLSYDNIFYEKATGEIAFFGSIIVVDLSTLSY